MRRVLCEFPSPCQLPSQAGRVALTCPVCARPGRHTCMWMHACAITCGVGAAVADYMEEVARAPPDMPRGPPITADSPGLPRGFWPVCATPPSHVASLGVFPYKRLRSPRRYAAVIGFTVFLETLQNCLCAFTPLRSHALALSRLCVLALLDPQHLPLFLLLPSAWAWAALGRSKALKVKALKVQPLEGVAFAGPSL